jgi:hypothetical protein
MAQSMKRQRDSCGRCGRGPGGTIDAVIPARRPPRLSSPLHVLVLTTALLGCAPARPDGAYTVEEFDAAGFGFGGGALDPSDGGTDIEPLPLEDGGAQVVDPDNPLSVLLGRYLMRVDAYSTASVSSAGNTLTIDNRVSNLSLVQLSLKPDGSLNSREQLCTQSYQSQCVSNCSDWKTTADPLLPRFCARRVTDRAIRIDAAGNLIGAASEIAIGFDEQAGNTTLPTVTDDARVWQLGTNRFAVNTNLTGKLGKAPLQVSLNCIVSSVQRFSTQFSGKLDLATFGKDALVQKPMRADTAASTAATIFVTGTPSMYCNKSALDGTSAQPDQVMVVVRFARFSGSSCPVDFDAQFAALPVRPGSAELM